MKTNHTINTKIPVEIDFYRDAEAEAINVKRNELDRATIVSAAIAVIRKSHTNSTAKKPA